MPIGGRDIPAELVEKILLSLPVKSLLRFSGVSKAWKSTIGGKEFVKTYRGREMLVVRIGDGRALVCPTSSMSTTSSPPWATEPFVRPFTTERRPYLNASCGGLWCVDFEDSICLYNPSTRTFRKLPAPPEFHICHPSLSCFSYGVGHDAVADDYKILLLNGFSHHRTAQLYSLQTDSWTDIHLPRQSLFPHIASGGGEQTSLLISSNGLFLGGSLYWLVNVGEKSSVLSFHLSSHEFGVLALPESVTALRRLYFIDAILLMGKICVSVNHIDDRRLDLWVMEEDHAWSKEIVVNYGHIPPLCHYLLKPLFFYDCGGRNLIKAITSSCLPQKMFVYEDSSTLVEKDLGCPMLDTYTYVECLLGMFSV